MILQFCGLSGSGKTTLAQAAKAALKQNNIEVEVIDGDEYRKVLCADLGFSKTDRATNIRRLAFVAGRMAHYDIIPIICAINPSEAVRKEVHDLYPAVKTIYIKCNIAELVRRDTKGLYARSFLPADNPDKLSNLSGVNDTFEEPLNPDLIIETDTEPVGLSCQKLIQFIKMHWVQEIPH